jgi:hypothetical protein
MPADGHHDPARDPADVLEKDEAGRIVFPYDAVHVDFVIGKVA